MNLDLIDSSVLETVLDGNLDITALEAILEASTLDNSDLPMRSVESPNPLLKKQEFISACNTARSGSTQDLENTLETKFSGESSRKSQFIKGKSSNTVVDCKIEGYRLSKVGHIMTGIFNDRPDGSTPLQGEEVIGSIRWKLDRDSNWQYLGTLTIKKSELHFTCTELTKIDYPLNEQIKTCLTGLGLKPNNRVRDRNLSQSMGMSTVFSCKPLQEFLRIKLDSRDNPDLPYLVVKDVRPEKKSKPKSVRDIRHNYYGLNQANLINRLERLERQNYRLKTKNLILTNEIQEARHPDSDTFIVYRDPSYSH